MRPTILLLGFALVLAACGSKSKCEKACKMKADCLRAENPGWTCPLSAECTPTEECLAQCILNSSCEAMTGKSPQAAVALQNCEALCTGAKPDKGVTPDHGPSPDGPVMPDKGPPSPDLPRPDAPPKPDQYVWPDHNIPPPDQFVWPDTYSGRPFGCQTDLDCFDLICCKTPWGVKICTPTCPGR
jgi:hypothetical protein